MFLQNLTNQGYVYTTADTQENTSFSLHFGLLSTLRWHFGPCENKLFEDMLSQVDHLKMLFRIVVWTLKMEVFKTNDACLDM